MEFLTFSTPSGLRDRASTIDFPLFPALDYTASYPDLASAFGTNPDLAWAHFRDFGAKEDRTITFNGLNYIASYPDLSGALGTDARQGALHYLQHGRLEGRAVTFNGTSGYMWTTQAVTNPQTFSLQGWFRTTSTLGGKLIGFGTGANGAASNQYDRHVYLTNAGQLVFGVGNYVTVTSPTAYNDGRWHLVTATYSAATGMKLYVDRALVASGAATTLTDYTGSWRLGFDVVHAAWAGAPQTGWFGGAMAHVGVFPTVLTDTQVFAQYDMGT